MLFRSVRNTTNPAIAGAGGFVGFSTNNVETTFFVENGSPPVAVLLLRIFIGQEITFIKVAINQWAVTKYNILDPPATWP